MVHDLAVKHIVLYISKRYPRVYGMLSLLMTAIMIITLSFFPYVYKSLGYSCLYEKQQVSGVVEDIVVSEKNLRIRNSHTTFRTYYLLIEDIKVWVTPSMAEKCEEGEVYEYYRYIRGNEVTGECFDYTLVGGLLGLLLEIGIVYIAAFYCFTDVKDKGNKENVKESALPLPREYKNYSAKELYEICLLNHIQVLDGKRRDRKYLERRLRNADDRYDPYLRKMKAEKSEKSKIVQVFEILCCIIVILCPSYYMYYFFYSFM